MVSTNNFDARTETRQIYLSGQEKSMARTGFDTATFDHAAFVMTTTSGGLVSTVTEDMLGRTSQTITPDSGATNYTYYSLNTTRGRRGKLRTSTDADGVTMTYNYDLEGDQISVSRSIPTTDANNQPITATHISTTISDYVPSINLHGTVLGVCQRTQTSTASTGVPTIVTGIRYAEIKGLRGGGESFGRKSLSVRTRPNAAGISTSTTTAPDGTKSIRITTHGLLTSTSTLSSDDVALSSTTYTYNAFQFPLSMKDSRHANSEVSSNFTENGTPLTQTNARGDVTVTVLDRHGRAVAMTLPDATVKQMSYHLSGQTAAEWGSQTNPTFRIYDGQGRMSELRTYQNLSSEPLATTVGSAKTNWLYSPTTGHLTGKRDDTGKGANYTHTAAGRIATRTWARSTVAAPKITTYAYTNGMMVSTDYSDTTPDVAVKYDPLGRPINQSTPISQSAYTYAADFQIDTETITHTLPGQAAFTRVIDHSQDTLGRDTGFELKNAAVIENSATYSYHLTEGRLENVANPSTSFIYGYEPNSYGLIKTVTSPIHTVTNTYEATRDILTSKQNVAGAFTRSSYTYGVNEIGQRTDLTTTFDLGGNLSSNPGDTDWGYNSRGEVTKADHTIPGLDRAYVFDSIGNRLKAAEGTTNSNDPSAINYTPNALNQYTAIGALNPVHDDDGNMTSSSLPANINANSTLVWDGENRLIQAQVTGGGTATYLYDSQSRRIATISGAVTSLTVYDGWNPIAEYSISNNQYSISKSFTWGMDLSGTMQGAGGVGGLLAVTDSTGTYFPTYDGNGNVSEYLDSTGNVSAHYEYDPFGKITVATGSKANDFAHRFSTKPLDATTGLYYYGYRFYDPNTGRWPSRDPIEEYGGINLYRFIRNSTSSKFDYLGLKLSEEEKLECIRSIEFALGELGEFYDKIIVFIESNPRCKKPKFICDCCAEGYAGYYGAGGGSVTVCWNNLKGKGDGEDLINMLKHELTHAYQDCKGSIGKDCESNMCAEIQAYFQEYPPFLQEKPDLIKDAIRDSVKKSLLGASPPRCGATESEVEKHLQKSFEKLWEKCAKKLF